MHNKSPKEYIDNLLLENDAVRLLRARNRGLPVVRLIYTHLYFLVLLSNERVLTSSEKFWVKNMPDEHTKQDCKRRYTNPPRPIRRKFLVGSKS